MKRILATALLALSLSAFADPQSPVEKCRLEMDGPLRVAHQMYTRGVAAPVIEYLARTDQALGGRGRWIVSAGARHLEVSEALGETFTEDQFIDDALEFCEGAGSYALPARERFTVKWLDI